MPGPYTHYLFSKYNFKGHKKEFYVASQGPDVFFYYGIVNSYPLINVAKSKKEIRDFGGYLHTINPSITFAFFINYYKNIKDESIKENVLEFIKGFLSHYVLDRNCHPYIYYETGAPLEDKTKPYHFYHMYFETLVDKNTEIYYKDKLKNKQKDFLSLDKKVAKEVSKMLYELSNYLKFKGLNKNSYYNALKSMEKATYLINSNFIHSLVFSKSLSKKRLYVMTHPKKLEEAPYGKKDVMNKENREWFDTVNNESKGTYSFFDFFDNAKLDLTKGIDLIDSLIKDDLTIEELKIRFDEFTRDINHDGVKPGSTKKYFDLLFEKE